MSGEAEKLAKEFNTYVPLPGESARLIKGVYLWCYFDKARRTALNLPLYFLRWNAPCVIAPVERALGRVVQPYEDLK